MSVVELRQFLFQDAFDRYGAGSDGSPYWDPDAGDTWTILSETYRVTAGTTHYSKNTIQNRALTADLQVEDFYAKYTVNHVTGISWGLYFRGQAGNNYYCLHFQVASLRLSKIVNGVESFLDDWAHTLVYSTDYDIEVKVTGSTSVRIQVWVNGTARIDYTDSSSPFGEGTIGIGNLQGSGSCDIRFDDFEVWNFEPYGEEMLVKASLGDRIRRFTIKFFNPEGFRSDYFAFNDEIDIWRGTTPTRIFRGNIEKITKQSQKGQEILVSGRDFTARLLMVNCTQEFTSQDLAQTLKDLLTTYAADFGQTNIENTGISLAPHYKLRRLYHIARELAKMADFEVWADENKDVFFRPKLYTDSGVTFTPSTNLLDYEFPEEGQTKVTRVVVYGKENVVVQVENAALREQLGYDRDGPPIVDPAIQTNAEAKARGEAFLKQYSGPLIGKLMTYGQETLNVGELVTVTIDEENIDTQFLVLEIEFVAPKMPETIITVAEYTTGIEDIVANLRMDADTALATDADLEATIERWVSLFESIVIEETKLTLSQRIASDSFILGNPTFGVLGSGGYGLGDRSGEWVIIHEEEDP